MFIQTRKGLNIFYFSEKITGEMYFPYGSRLAREMQWINTKCGRRENPCYCTTGNEATYTWYFPLETHFYHLWKTTVHCHLDLTSSSKGMWDCLPWNEIGTVLSQKQSPVMKRQVQAVCPPACPWGCCLQAQGEWQKLHLTLNRFIKPFYSLYSPKATARAVQQLAKQVLIKQW